MLQTLLSKTIRCCRSLTPSTSGLLSSMHWIMHDIYKCSISNYLAIYLKIYYNNINNPPFFQPPPHAPKKEWGGRRNVRYIYIIKEIIKKIKNNIHIPRWWLTGIFWTTSGKTLELPSLLFKPLRLWHL